MGQEWKEGPMDSSGRQIVEGSEERRSHRERGGVERDGRIVSSRQDADSFSCWREEDSDHILDGDSQAQGKPDRQSMA